MKKKAYRSRAPEALPTPNSSEIPTPNSSAEGLNSSNPGSGIGRGLSLPAEPVALYDEDSEVDFGSRKKRFKRRSVDPEKLKDLFVMLGDAMDESREYQMANFADFILKKIAEQNSLDYSLLFKDLLVKIVESDVLDKNKLIEELVSVFNRVLVLNMNNNGNIDSSKLEAYQAAVYKAKEHIQ